VPTKSHLYWLAIKIIANLFVKGESQFIILAECYLVVAIAASEALQRTHLWPSCGPGQSSSPVPVQSHWSSSPASDRLTKRLIVCWRCSRCRISQPATPHSPFISSCTCLLSLSWQFVPNLAPKLPMWSGAGNLNKWRTKVDSAINLLNSKYWQDHSWVCSIVIVELFIMGWQIDLKFRLTLHRQWA